MLRGVIICIAFACVITTAYALPLGDVMESNHIESDNFTFDSGILDIDTSFFEQSKFKRYLIFGTGTPDFDYTYGIQSSGGFFYVATLSEFQVPKLLAKGYHIMEDFELDYHDSSRIGLITGYEAANSKYDVTGNNITIGIVDTGVDFSNPDIQQSLARDEFNHPLMLDPDGQGLVITNSTFFAFIDKDGIIRNYSKPIPDGFTSLVYQNRDGIFLDLDRGGQGTNIPIYNSFFPLVGNAPTFNGTINNDMKIGDNNRDYIKSQSGVYHLGVIYQGGLTGPYTRVQVIPVLVVDSNVPGTYDTIIPDLSTAWEDYTRFDLEENAMPDYDFDFTDEQPVILGSGNEFLIYDFDGDGRADYSAGTIGAHVLDVYSVIQSNITHIDDVLLAVNGTLLEPFDNDGNFFGIMTDFVGHGTSSAASITSQGIQNYDLYNDTSKHTITGVAPGSKILPIKALWFGDTIYSWLWAAGFENDNLNWSFTGEPKVDIISNSWGISAFPTLQSAPGMDILSLVASTLTTPTTLDDDFHGVVMVSSAGNSGHGYGTVGIPGSSPFGITVGATTNNIFVGYGPFEGQPRFGNSTAHYNHIVDFSSRGPTIIGDPKPDLVNIGAFGFVPSNMLQLSKDSHFEPFTLFGGTSMAAPLVSGSAAILMESMYNQQKNYDPFTIKNILMSTATDLGNDPFTQGAGLSNIDTALDFIHGNNGVFIVHNDASYHNIRNILDPAISDINYTEIGLEKFEFPKKTMPMTGWFAGHLLPGESSTATFTVENPTDSPLDVVILPQKLQMIKQDKLLGTTEPQKKDLVLDGIDAFAPNYVNLSDVHLHENLSEFFDDDNPIPPDTSLMVLDLTFEFSDFMNKTDTEFADDLKISSLYLYDWIDDNNDTRVSSNELSMVSRAGSWGTVQELRISDPLEKFDGTPLIGVYPVPQRFSYWVGETGMNSTSMDYSLFASYYNKEKWPLIWPNSENLVVPPNDSATVDVTLAVPTDLQTGTYQGFLTFEGDSHTVNAPVSFAVVQSATENVVISGNDSNNPLLTSGEIRGAFDMTSRYMTGDWRQYYFDVNNVDSSSIELSWQHEDTNLAIFVMDPKGRIIQTNMPSGVFGHFLGWPSLDWLGNSPFSEGGGFFPVKNKNNTSTVLLVPINQTGIHSMLVHSTLFGGNTITEPISLYAKFSDTTESEIIPIEPTQDIQDNISDKLDIPSDKPEIYLPTETPAESLVFDHGLLLGIILGVIIGVISILAIKRPQKQQRGIMPI